MSGQFAKYLDDPYAKQIDRHPIEAEHEVVLIGGGFGGLQAGARRDRSRDSSLETDWLVGR